MTTPLQKMGFIPLNEAQMIKALLRITDWHYNLKPGHTHLPVRAADLARQFQVKPAAVRQVLTALGYRPNKFKSRLNAVTAYREWWWAPKAVIQYPCRGRPFGSLGTVPHAVLPDQQTSAKIT